MAFVADHTKCDELRANTKTRYTGPEFMASNIASNGHPSVSGALDPKVLCAFSRDGVCTRMSGTNRATSTEKQRAVLNHKVQGQLNGSFRSAERALQSQVNRTRNMQVARCEQLLQVSEGH